MKRVPQKIPFIIMSTMDIHGTETSSGAKYAQGMLLSLAQTIIFVSGTKPTKPSSLLCGYTTMWLYHYVAILLCGYTTMWLYHYVAIPLCGYTTMWLYHYVAIPLCGYILARDRKHIWHF